MHADDATNPYITTKSCAYVQWPVELHHSQAQYVCRMLRSQVAMQLSVNMVCCGRSPHRSPSLRLHPFRPDSAPLAQVCHCTSMRQNTYPYQAPICMQSLQRLPICVRHCVHNPRPGLGKVCRKALCAVAPSTQTTMLAKCKQQVQLCCSGLLRCQQV